MSNNYIVNYTALSLRKIFGRKTPKIKITDSAIKVFFIILLFLLEFQFSYHDCSLRLQSNRLASDLAR